MENEEKQGSPIYNSDFVKDLYKFILIFLHFCKTLSQMLQKRLNKDKIRKIFGANMRRERKKINEYRR